MYLQEQQQKHNCNMLDKDQSDMDVHQHGSLMNDAFYAFLTHLHFTVMLETNLESNSWARCLNDGEPLLITQVEGHFLCVGNNFFEGRIQFFCEGRVGIYKMIQKYASVRLTTIYDSFLV